MKATISRSIAALAFTLMTISLYAQQKEVIVDFSSKQKPDSIYAKPKAEPATVVENSLAESANVEIPSQTLDSIRRELKMLRREVDNSKNIVADMQMNFRKSHKKFRIGTLLAVGGYLAYNIGAALITQAPAGQVGSAEVLLVVGGFGATITGIVFMINSHKYIGKAGAGQSERRYYNNDNNTLRYR